MKLKGWRHNFGVSRPPFSESATPQKKTYKESSLHSWRESSNATSRYEGTNGRYRDSDDKPIVENSFALRPKKPIVSIENKIIPHDS